MAKLICNSAPCNPATPQPAPTLSQLPTLHLDDDLIVVNKPAGILSAEDGVNPALPSLLERELGSVWVVHRLDKDTSGAIVYALNPDCHRELSLQFEAHEVRKVYHALVIGTPPWNEFTVDAPLRSDADRHHRTVIDPNGKPAVTHLRVLKRISTVHQSYTLIEARPETGRTHQIRVHLRATGHPIVADALYGDGQPLLLSRIKRNYRHTGETAERPLMGRVALHAQQLTFIHPSSQDELSITAPYPKDFAASLKQL